MTQHSRASATEGTWRDVSVLRRALAIAGVVPVHLEGGSMWPLVASGATGRVVACTRSELRLFDVAVYERHGRIIAHLIARIDPTGPIPSGLGLSAEPAALVDHELLGRLDGLVVRRRTWPVPRSFARTTVRVAHALRARFLAHGVA